ncbi:MAG: sensor histidine kinase [Acidobacteriota bacterium]
MRHTILYVDDDPANLTVLEAACAGEFTVITAPSGRAALELLHEREIAVLLADQRMPEMSGTELLEAVREAYPDTVRILVTAYSDLSAAVGAVNRGQIRHYISKPWDPDHLRAVLREALDVYDTKRQVRDLEQRLLETERVYALGIVAAGIAHELRNPLSTIQTTLELAQVRLRALTESLVSRGNDTRDETELAQHLARHLATVGQAVGQLREITSGIELANRRRDDQHSTDIGEVTRLTVRCVRAELLKRAQFNVEIATVPEVRGSPNKLGQVLMNLLINAFEALPDRPRSENRVMVRLQQSGGLARLEVEDNGSGIPPDVRTRIFDPFFTTKSRGGTGLGLAISRQIVEEVDGRIEVDSTPGRGTRFVVELPFAPTIAKTDRPA